MHSHGRAKAFLFWLFPMSMVLATLACEKESAIRDISVVKAIVAENFPSERPWEGRFVGIKYAPFSGLAREPQNKRQLAQVRRLVEKWIEKEPTPEAFAAMALLWHVDGKFDRSIGFMERAIENRPRNYWMLNDISVMLLSRAGSNNEAEDLLLALSAVSQALALAPRSPEARFNSALIISKLYLIGEARAAWESYLVQDESTQWADEARNYRASLGQQTVGGAWEKSKSSVRAALSKGKIPREQIEEFPHQIRLLVEEDLFAQWAEALQKGEGEEARSKLSLAKEIGEIVGGVIGDYMIRDAVAAIETVGEGCIADLTAGHLAYARGVHLLKNGDYADALAHFEGASSDVSCSDTPFRFLALLQAATCKHYLRQHGLVLREVGEYANDPALRRYPLLRARALWLDGLSSIMLDRFVESLSSYQQALELYKKVYYDEGVIALHFLIAENLRFQGLRREAWQHRYQALRLSADVGPTIWLHNTLFDAIEEANAQALQYPALILNNEMLGGPSRLEDATSRAEALVKRGKTLIKVGELEAARRDLASAEKWISRLEPSYRQAALTASHEVALAEWAQKSHPELARESLTSAISFYEKARDFFWLPTLYSLRAQANHRLGDLFAAESDFLAAAKFARSGGLRLTGERLRLSYLDRWSFVHDAIVDFYVNARLEPQRALEYSEYLRAWELGPKGENGVEVVRLSEIQSNLPTSTVLVRFVLLEKKLLVWLIGRDRFSFYEQKIDLAWLEGRSKEFRRTLESGQWAADGLLTSESLYRVLIAPIATDLRREDTLVIVPDKVLHLIPFAALVNRETGRYLIEDNGLIVSTSVSVYLRALASSRDPQKAAGSTASLLAIGNPAFDQTFLRDLAPLPGSEREAEGIAAAYEESTVLTGEGATKTALLAEMHRHSILHLAGHIRYNSDFPLLSYIPLAAEYDSQVDAEALYAYEIYSLGFERTQLVVLAGCDSLRSNITSTEGLYSFARALVAMGVPSVVGSSWKSRDRHSEIFFTAFHESIVKGEGASTAVRRVQVSFIRSEDEALQNPSVWSSFQVFGATVE